MNHFVLTLAMLFGTDAPKDEGVKFPQIVQPAITPSPMQVTKLGASQLYIVTSYIPCYVLSSPLGLVSISEEAGPIVIRGSFVDGTKPFETRTYRQKQVFIVEATGSGTVELLVVIVGKTKPEEVLRKTLSVDNGNGPRPPPDPPIPPSDPFVASLQAAYIADGKPANQLPLLTAVFRKSATIVNDPKMKTPYDMARVVHLSVAGILEEPDEKVTTKMVNTRKAIGAELDKYLPVGPASVVNLDPTLRSTIAAQYLRVQRALEGVTP